MAVPKILTFSHYDALAVMDRVNRMDERKKLWGYSRRSAFEEMKKFTKAHPNPRKYDMLEYIESELNNERRIYVCKE